MLAGMPGAGTESTGTDTAFARVLSDPASVPGALVFSVFCLYLLKSGGYAATIWYPGALLLLVLAAMAVVAQVRAGSHLARATAVAALLLAAFTVWCFASIAWSGSRGIAWDGANRTLLYLVVFVLGACLPWRCATAGTLLVGLSLVVATTGFVEVARAAASHPSNYFPLGRFAAPFDYQNAACAAYMMAFWPALLAASRREVPILVRAISLAAACVLPELALLSQSRTSLLAVPVTAAVYLVLVPDRARTLIVAAAPLLALVLTRGRLLDVFPAFRDGGAVGHVIIRARDSIALSAGFGFGFGFVVALIDRLVAAPRVRRVAGRALLTAVGVAAGVALVVGVSWLRHPEARLQHAWTTFKVTQPTSRHSYFANGLGGNRYDIWRVAWHEFKASPVRGVGVDNFQSDYLRLRRSQEEPLYPHSVELRLLSQTGIVGASLFAGFVGALLVALRRFRRLPRPQRSLAGAALATTTYWFAHGSVDWFWEIPFLGTVAFVSLGIAASLARGRELPERPSRRVQLPLAFGVVACTALLAASLLLPWLAAEEVVRAATGWRANPAQAFARLDRARLLNPASDGPDLVAGAIASRLGDRGRMKLAFQRALQRDPRSWYAHLELAVAASLEGRRTLALRHLAAARRLDPREPVIAEVARDVRAGRRVSPSTVDRAFLARIQL